MTYNLSFYCIRIFLFIFSSPTYNWCDTDGQQRTTILGVGGRQSWTGNHGNTVLPSLIPWPCQRVDKYLCKPRPIQHLHKGNLPNLHNMKVYQGGRVLMDCFPTVSPYYAFSWMHIHMNGFVIYENVCKKNCMISYEITVTTNQLSLADWLRKV